MWCIHKLKERKKNISIHGLGLEIGPNLARVQLSLASLESNLSKGFADFIEMS